MATWTPQTKNASTFTESSKSGLADYFLEIGEGFFLSIGDGFNLLIEKKTRWADSGKNSASWSEITKN